MSKIEEERKAKGLCPKCGNPTLPGYVLCAEHHRRSLLRQREKYRIYEEMKRCPRCGAFLDEGYSYKLCADCRQYFARYNKQMYKRVRRTDE